MGKEPRPTGETVIECHISPFLVGALVKFDRGERGVETFSARNRVCICEHSVLFSITSMRSTAGLVSRVFIALGPAHVSAVLVHISL